MVGERVSIVMVSYGYVIVMIVVGVVYERYSEIFVGVYVVFDFWMRMVRYGLRNYE